MSCHGGGGSDWGREIDGRWLGAWGLSCVRVCAKGLETRVRCSVFAQAIGGCERGIGCLGSVCAWGVLVSSGPMQREARKILGLGEERDENWALYLG